MRNNPKALNYLSIVHSVLRCSYGWPKYVPDGMSRDDWESIIFDGFESDLLPHEVAEILAVEFAERGGEFLPRIDGQPNTLRPKVSELRKLINQIKKHKQRLNNIRECPEHAAGVHFCIINSSLCQNLKKRLIDLLFKVALRNRPLWVLMRAEWNLEPLSDDFGDMSYFDEIPF